MRIGSTLAVLGVLLGFASPAQARVCDEVSVAMSDGVGLHAWVSRAEPADARRPVLFMMDSYSRGGYPGRGPRPDNACPETLPDDYVPAFLAKELPDRFTLVQVAYRGTGSSEGLFDVTGARTQQDLGEALAWADALPQANGTLLVVGESGTGFAAHHALSDPHVDAAVIFTSCADMYRCFRRGGTYNTLADVYMASTMLGYAVGSAKRPPDPAQAAALADAVEQPKTRLTFDSWYAERSALGKLPKANVPVLYTADPYDIVQPFDALALTPGARLNFAMGHLAVDAAKAGGERWNVSVRRQVDRFVAHHGLGEDNGALRDAPVTIATLTGSHDGWHRAEALAREEDAWPLTGTRWTTLRLGGDGALAEAAAAAVAAARTAPLVPTPRGDLRGIALLAGTSTPTDLRAEEALGLSWTTPAFKRDLEVTGPLTLRLTASTSAPDFDLIVRVTDVHPGGASEWITDGALRASLRKLDPAQQRGGRVWHTFDERQPVPAGASVEYAVDVIPTSNVFRAGHRLRVSLLSVAGGALDSPVTGGAGTVTVHDGALTLPVIGDRCDSGTPLAEGTPKVACAGSFAEALGGGPEVVVPRACVSRRRVRLRVAGGTKVYLRGRLVRTVRRRAVVDLRGLPKGRFTVRVVPRDGTAQVRRYRTCTRKQARA